MAYEPFERGSFPVGVRTFNWNDEARGRPLTVEVWYPATDAHRGQERVLVRKEDRQVGRADSSDFTRTEWITLIDLAHQHAALPDDPPVNDRPGRPTRDLQLAKIRVGESEGLQIVSGARTASKDQKRVQRLRKKLCKLFLFSSNPIEPIPGRGSRLRFGSVLIEDD